ncbi:MAG TPA: hypothetical protein PLN48_15180 [Lachnospiraceae bacterium]|nr:hypothetical protein [Lachnospiraceae bacterium]
MNYSIQAVFPEQKYCEFQAAGGKTYDLSAAGIPWHIFFSASRENIFRKYCHGIPAAASGAT